MGLILLWLCGRTPASRASPVQCCKCWKKHHLPKILTFIQFLKVHNWPCELKLTIPALPLWPTIINTGHAWESYSMSCTLPNQIVLIATIALFQVPSCIQAGTEAVREEGRTWAAMEILSPTDCYLGFCDPHDPHQRHNWSYHTSIET